MDGVKGNTKDAIAFLGHSILAHLPRERLTLSASLPRVESNPPYPS
jgi:hypothetical protein